MDDDEDLALTTLMSVRADVAADLDQEILAKAYAIQRRHQFSDDHAQSSAAMERLIDEAVNSERPDGEQA